MSTGLPIVFFQCFPARAIRRNRLSPSSSLCREFGEVIFAASNIEDVGPEKNAKML